MSLRKKFWFAFIPVAALGLAPVAAGLVFVVGGGGDAADRLLGFLVIGGGLLLLLLLLPLLSQGTVRGAMLVECSDDFFASSGSDASTLSALIDQRLVILQGIAYQTPENYGRIKAPSLALTV